MFVGRRRGKRGEERRGWPEKTIGVDLSSRRGEGEEQQTEHVRAGASHASLTPSFVLSLSPSLENECCAMDDGQGRGREEEEERGA